MNLKKLFAATAFAAALTTAFAVNAFADTTMVATYNNGTVTLTDAPTLNPATLLVLNTNEGVALTNVTASDIKQIDEVDEEYTYSSVVVGELADGTYEVRIGGDGTITSAFFTVGSEAADRLVGDVNGSELVDIMDLGMLSLYIDDDASTVSAMTIDALDAADTNDSGLVDIMDLSTMSLYIDGAIEGFSAEYTKDKTNHVSLD